MRENHRTAGRTALVLTGLLGMLAVAFAGSASAGSRLVPVTTIEFASAGKHELHFENPRTVGAGEALRILNNTNPQKVGPHTFTLVTEAALPTTERQQKRCFRKGRICRKVAGAHHVDFQTGEVHKPIVDNGQPGFDRMFSINNPGDSWFTETKGEEYTSPVSADEGTTLHFFCVVHPFLQGKIKVN